VFVRAGKIFVVFALVAVLGAHLAVLQTIAWTTMLADNLRCDSFSQAMTRTFDGKHPCALCKAIAAARKSERKNDVLLQKQKLEFPPFGENVVLIAPSKADVFPRKNSFAKSFVQKPPTPPPRASLV
jgi:hypothetical protein